MYLHVWEYQSLCKTVRLCSCAYHTYLSPPYLESFFALARHFYNFFLFFVSIFDQDKFLYSGPMPLLNSLNVSFLYISDHFLLYSLKFENNAAARCSYTASSYRRLYVCMCTVWKICQGIGLEFKSGSIAIIIVLVVSIVCVTCRQ